MHANEETYNYSKVTLVTSCVPTILPYLNIKKVNLLIIVDFSILLIDNNKFFNLFMLTKLQINCFSLRK